ncbi:sialate O-acetylesterase [Flavicella sediminum]|uniref:sialate O-acetylesterase n=1 Tax=Flavicella sediminum TaxID=2585141 RepID=UPI0011206C86|nr:sialate O-acetylesterase [Flavicella sediminum]
MKSKFLFLLVLSTQFILTAQTKLPDFFSDQMVLQQNEKVTIWGTDKPNKKIKITSSWGEKQNTKADANGKWKLKIQTPKAGGPYTVNINGSDKIELNDVYIGEVWLCSGQSNMEMPVKGFNNQAINHSQEEILNSSNPHIRMFSVKRNPSMSLQENVQGQWKVAAPNTTGDFSAVAYFFGKKIESILQVPVGLIVTCWGGSSAEAWTDKETLQEFKTIELPTELKKNGVQHTPFALYNGMINPLVGYGIKGAIWYQGESNKERASNYTALINAMVTSWRNKWEQGDFSFYTTQIAPFKYGNKTNSAYLREAQLKTSLNLKNSGMAVTLDIGDAKFIHPREKKTVGNRLAYWALSKDYNIAGLDYSGPIYKSLKITDKNKIQLQFSGSSSGLNSFGKELKGFEIAGADKVFYPAQAKIVKSLNTLEVSSEKVKNPVAVRYAFTNTPEATLFSTSGLPASSFRTDDW